jgi:hypothetical protein
MSRFWRLAIVLAFGLSTLSASAAELTGTISNIDLTRNTFVINGRTFTASPTSTVGTKLSDLQEGDTVKIEIGALPGDPSLPGRKPGSGKQPINVMTLEKVE